ncbi:MAG TPA: hypothetical protein VIE65_22345 [Methylobacter sp.]
MATLTHMGIILHRMDMAMVFGTPDKCHMETMAIAIISLIEDMTNTMNVGNTANVDMVAVVEVMDSIGVIMTMIN